MKKIIFSLCLVLACAATFVVPVAQPALAQDAPAQEQGGAQGIGRMTVEEYAVSRGMQPIEVVQKLVQRGADVKFTTSMKDAAAQLGMKPRELEAELFPR